MKSKIDIKITGEGIEPSNFSFKKLNEIVDKYFRVLVSIATAERSGLEFRDAKFSLLGISKGSVDLSFIDLDEHSDLYISSIALADAIEQDNICNLPMNAQNDLSEFGKALKSYDTPLCAQLFNQAGLAVTIQPDEIIKEIHIVNSIETIYGELTDVGGAKPNVHLLTKNGSITGEVTKAQAIELGSRLYTQVGLTGRVDRKAGGAKPERFIVDRIEPYDESKWKENIKKIQDLFSERFDGVNVEQFFRDIRSE